MHIEAIAQRSKAMAFAISLAVFSFFGATQEAAATTPSIHDEALPNGLQVIIIEDPRIPAVSHNLLFRLGAADDARGKSGLAHYLEHMLFQGTKKHKPNEFSRIIAARGGKTNAFTTADYTGYWVNIAKEHLPKVMELEADRLQYLSPPEADFAKEQQIILEERRSRVDNNPAALFREQVNAQLYYHHPYGTPIIGWPKEMEALNRDDVMRYYDAYYHPKNAILILAGDITKKQGMKLAKRYYGDLSSRNKQAVAPRVEEPVQLGERRFIMKHPQVKQAEWSRRMLVPSYGWQREENEAKILPLMVAEYLLGGSKTSRLYRRLVEGDKLVTEVAVSYSAFRMGPGEFNFYVTPKSEKDLPKIEKIIAEEIAELIKNPPKKKDLNRAKTQLIASNVYLQDGLQSLARVIGHLHMVGLPLDYYFNWEKHIEALTAEQVSESLTLLNADYSVTGTLLPKKIRPSK